MDLAGTAVFRDTRLVGFLTVDETQALLALRGEMGKAYLTLPDPTQPGRAMTLRFHQENLPQYRADLTPAGPRVAVRLLFEGEMVAGDADFTRPDHVHRIEAAAAQHMRELTRRVLDRLQQWQTDPVGFGLLFRGRFGTWQEWEAFGWRQQIPRLQVQVSVEMRLRRFGLIHTEPPAEEE